MKRSDLLDLNEAVQNPGKRLRFDVATELAEEEDLDLLEGVAGAIEAVSTGNLLLLKGRFETKCVLECARCGHGLERSLEFEMSDEFDVEGVPSCYGKDGYAEVVEQDEFPVFSKNALIKDAWIRQGLLINMPSQPLCEHGWDGDCPFAKQVAPKPVQQSGHPSLQKLGDLLTGDESK